MRISGATAASAAFGGVCGMIAVIDLVDEPPSGERLSGQLLVGNFISSAVLGSLVVYLPLRVLCKLFS